MTYASAFTAPKSGLDQVAYQLTGVSTNFSTNETIVIVGALIVSVPLIVSFLSNRMTIR